MSEERTRRIALNEALFRSVNESLEGLNEAFALAGTMTVVCECGEIGCAEQITMSLPEYEALRADPTLFAVVPGHEATDVEEVVGRRGGYDVVRKVAGLAADVARATDPRR